ncbi:MAG TPA: glycosyltransferase family 2 protein, partial [Acidimicrobiales bacterium]|nr:glycosyltransferase family 2 protein [Acidimicrobiales bacterium]
VVNYNARDHLLACVRSLRAQGVGEIVVADNASSDGSAEALAASDANVVLVPTGANLGYGTAANRGVAACHGELFLVCNPDVTFGPGAVEVLVAALGADAGLALVGPRIEEPDGSLYPSARTFPGVADALGHAFLGLVAPGNRFTRRYRMLDWDHSRPGDVDWVSGSCFLVRRSAWEALGGFEEAFFMYAEDVDLCWRARRAGLRVGYEPAACVVHVKGVSTDQAPYRMIVAHHRSLLRFYQRSTTGWRRGLLPLVAAGLAVRTGLVAAQRAVEGVRAR